MYAIDSLAVNAIFSDGLTRTVMRHKVGITLRLNYSTNRLHNASHDYSILTEIMSYNFLP